MSTNAEKISILCHTRRIQHELELPTYCQDYGIHRHEKEFLKLATSKIVWTHDEYLAIDAIMAAIEYTTQCNERARGRGERGDHETELLCRNILLDVENRREVALDIIRNLQIAHQPEIAAICKRCNINQYLFNIWRMPRKITPQHLEYIQSLHMTIRLFSFFDKAATNRILWRQFENSAILALYAMGTTFKIRPDASVALNVDFLLSNVKNVARELVLDCLNTPTYAKIAKECTISVQDLDDWTNNTNPNPCDTVYQDNKFRRITMRLAVLVDCASNAKDTTQTHAECTQGLFVHSGVY